MLNLLLVAGIVGLYVSAAAFAFQALRQARTAQGAAGWVIFLLLAPVLGVPAYVIFGQTHFPRRVARHRDIQRVIRQLRLAGTAHDHREDGEIPADPARIHAFERLAGVPLVGQNRLDLLIDGAETFPAIFAAIREAQDYVLVSYYTIRDDRLGRELLDCLTERARSGVRVRVLYDGIGSKSLTKRYIRAVRDAGGEILDFNPNRIFKSRFQMNFRNHRKIVVVDGRVAFIGGLNIGDEYMGHDPHLGDWRDTHLEIEGPVVAQVQLSFAEDWLWASGEVLSLKWVPDPSSGGTDALIVAPSPADQLETGGFYFCNGIEAARDRLWLASPYFVPDAEILTALKLAALRGVDVRILVPERADQYTPWLAAHSVFDEVRDVGVRIYRYTEGFMHQKVMLIDDDIASVGSINLDNRSCRLNFEITLIGLGTEFNGRVAEMLERDFQRSSLFDVPLDDNPSPFVRYGAPIARLFAPIL